MVSANSTGTADTIPVFPIARFMSLATSAPSCSSCAVLHLLLTVTQRRRGTPQHVILPATPVCPSLVGSSGELELDGRRPRRQQAPAPLRCWGNPFLGVFEVIYSIHGCGIEVRGDDGFHKNSSLSIVKLDKNHHQSPDQSIAYPSPSYLQLQPNPDNGPNVPLTYQHPKCLAPTLP